MSALASITAMYSDSDDEADTTTSSIEESQPKANVELVPNPDSEQTLQVPSSDKDNNGEKKSPDESDDRMEDEGNNMEIASSIIVNPAPSTTGPGLVSYIDQIDDDAIDDYTPEITHEKDDDSMDTSPSQTDDVEQSPDSIAAKRRALLPPETKGTCSAKLQSKFNKLHEDKMNGRVNMNEYIQNRKMFRNPSIYEKLIQFCNIKEFGTNYPPEVYNPYEWPESSNYINLAKLQKEEMERREKAKKDRVKIEYVSGAAKKPVGIVTSIPIASSAPTVINPNASASETETKRKSKWDQRAVFPIIPGKK